MHVLFVEDNKTFAEAIASSLRKTPGSTVTVAASRDSAMSALREQFFDILVLDLGIPTRDDGLDIAPEHGQTVFYEALNSCPGTPIFILTGSEPDAFALSLARLGNQIDLWGTGHPIATIDYRTKESADQLLDSMNMFAKEIATTDAITIDTRGRKIDLSVELRRALKVFTRAHGGVSCEIQRVGGGLSGALTLRMSVKDEQAHDRLLCIAKLGSAQDVQCENDAFEQHVKLLRIGAATPLLKHINRGLRGFAGVFYSLAEDHDETLFDVIAKRPQAVAPILHAVRAGMERWPGAGTMRQVKVQEIRRRLLSDGALAEIQKKFDLPEIAAVEELEVRAHSACIHGDLHGGNILISNKDAPILIDFGDVGPGFSCIDPITLELSMIFHPDSNQNGVAQSLLGRIHDWPDIESYCTQNPLSPVIEACRDWAHDQGGSDGAVLAAGYAFAVRQLKYETVDPQVTTGLIRAISTKLVHHVRR
ncbi:phosphotransferase [Achromobacter dolens]